MTLYTYIAARVYVGYAGIWLLWWLITEKEQRRGALIAIGIIILTALPLIFALIAPAETADSIGRAAASDFAQIQENLVNWANAWIGRGDVSSTHNLPNRPVLDIPLAILALAGLIGAMGHSSQKMDNSLVGRSGDCILNADDFECRDTRIFYAAQV